MANFTVKKGLDLPLAGRPETDVVEAAFPTQVAVYPGEYPEIKPKVQVEVGSEVERGSVLVSCKKREGLQICAPAAGKVSAINLGPRRSIREIVIDTDPANKAVKFGKFSADAIAGIERKVVIDQLMLSGLMTLIEQRPFSRIASATARPKSIFVNAMQTAPFGADVGVGLEGYQAAFQAGLDLMTRLTERSVFLNVSSESESKILLEAQNVEINRFSGPHPSGNSSVHIDRLDPISPNDVVWTVKALDLALIGRLFLEGELPTHEVIALGGPGIRPEFRRHYRIVRGSWLADLLQPALVEGEQRVICGDVLTGEQVDPESGMRARASGVTVLFEERSREFLGWLAPGLKTFSSSRLFLSRWLRPNAEWNLTTADHGGERAMFATGVYDRVMPLDIMVDFLLRAVIAHDTEEAVQLGILEVDPKDFALCSYLCPSRTDVVGMIRRGLEEIEEEGVYTEEQD